MAYARPLETGTYIYSDGEYMHFLLEKISESDLNILLACLHDHHKAELEMRIEEGRRLIAQNRIEMEETDNEVWALL